MIDKIHRIRLTVVAATLLQLSLLMISNISFAQEIDIQEASGPNPWTNLNWNNKSENFQFVVVTDRTGGNRPGVFEQGVAKVNLLQPEFVMSVGDLIQGYTEDLPELNRQWDEFDSFVNQLEMPFFYVPGNHDITNNTMEELWAKRYGKTYYHFVYQDVLFLCLNSEEPVPAVDGNAAEYHTSDFYLSRKQREYAINTLEANPDVRWTFVFWHKPVWLYENSDNQQLKESIPASGWPEIENLLKQRKHTVFAGHIHRYVHQQRNDADYITLATTGGGSALRGPIFGQFDHVLWVTMTDEGPVMANLLLQGIFDKEFSKEDIEQHLELSMKHKVMRIDSKFDDSEPLTSDSVKFTLFNHQDFPAEVTLDFANSKNIEFAENQQTLTIPPNSAISGGVAISILPLNAQERAGIANQDLQGWNDRWDELKRHYVNWSLVYDLDRYGKTQLQGKTRLFR